uniref:BHLH domain-containing protein n=1 Tax=Plectus sambesii TaxID=2011161 RepID=A0A914XTN7_9BILA
MHNAPIDAVPAIGALLESIAPGGEGRWGERRRRLMTVARTMVGKASRLRRIEKRRRDRINLCLAELRRLVPAAFEKQGSQKLEKAEILQLTVEHLKFLHSTGVNTLLYDTPDYRSAGFRACASEVDRYLTEREGMDIQDPRRDKLERYLQCNGTQQMAQNKAAAVVGWPNCHPQTHVPTTAQQVFTHPTTPTSIYPHPSSTATYPRPINIDTKQFAATIYPHQTGFAFQGLTAGPQMQNL